MEEIKELYVTDLSRGGAGVARDKNGQVVFIPYAAPGDRLRVRILEKTKRYSQGEIVEILEPSLQRQKPPCSVFGQCGGCQWQHLPYDLQWKTKHRGVQEALKRRGIDSVKLDEIPATQIWEYRNRVQLRGDGNRFGFYRSRSQEVISADRCEIARFEINQVWKEVRREGEELSQPYKVEVEVLPTGVIRKTWNAPHAAHGFRQVHDEQNQKLREWIFSSLEEADYLLDLFGGAGNLSLPLVSKMKEIHCVDLSVPLVRPNNAPSYFYFYKEKVDSWLERHRALFSQKASSLRGCAIVDPPRQGLGEWFNKIEGNLRQMGIKQVIAVGCDPDSWARDLSQWIKNGWHFKRGMVIDLFPQTPHVEALALLGRNKPQHEFLL